MKIFNCKYLDYFTLKTCEQVFGDNASHLSFSLND